ncbi:hypothetical protein ABPG72_000028 [Tetrahymena utriculariae]
MKPKNIFVKIIQRYWFMFNLQIQRKDLRIFQINYQIIQNRFFISLIFFLLDKNYCHSYQFSSVIIIKFLLNQLKNCKIQNQQNMKQKSLLIIFVSAIHFQLVVSQICQIGCEVCDQLKYCQQCAPNFELDINLGQCVYQLCDQNLYWQIKYPLINYSSSSCQSICDEGYWINNKLNICQQIYPCSKSFVSFDAIDSQKQILRITQYNLNSALIFYEDKINLISLSDGQLQKSFQFQGNTLFALYLQDYFFIFNNDQSIQVQYIGSDFILSNIEIVGKFNSFTQLLLLNNNVYLIANSRQSTNTLIIKKTFNIQSYSFLSDNTYFQLKFNDEEQMFVFNSSVIITSLKGIKIIQIQEIDSVLTVQNYTNDFICSQFASIQIQDFSSFDNSNYYYIISNSVQQLIKINKTECGSLQLDSFPKQLILIQQNNNQYIFIGLKNKILVFDTYFQSSVEVDLQQQTQLLELKTLQRLNNTILVALFNNSTLAFYSFTGLQNIQPNQIQLVKQQQIKISQNLAILSFSNQIDSLDTTQFQIYSYFKDIYVYNLNFTQQTIDLNFQMILNTFQRKNIKLTQQIVSIQFNNNQLLSASSIDGKIQTWDTSSYFYAKIIDSIQFKGYGNCQNFIYFTNVSLLILFESCIIRYNVITHKIENQWNFSNQHQTNRFIAIQSNHATLIFDNCLIIIDQNNNQVGQDCSQSFQEMIQNVEFTIQYFIIIQKQYQIITYQLDIQSQPPQLKNVNTFNSNYQIWQTKIRNYPKNYLKNTSLEIVIFKANFEFLILNEYLQVNMAVPNIFLYLPIDINFYEQGPDDEFYFILGKSFQNITSFQNSVYAISKVHNNSQVCIQTNEGKNIFKVFKFFNAYTNSIIYEIKIISVSNLYSQIQTFLWGINMRSSVVNDIQQLKGLQFSYYQAIQNDSYFVAGDQSGALALSFIKRNMIQSIYSISNGEQNLQQYIIGVQQSLELGLFFIIKQNIVVFNLFTNEIQEVIELEKSPDNIEKFFIITEHSSIIALKKNTILLKNYFKKQVFTFNNQQTVLGFIVNDQTVYTYGSNIYALDLNLTIILSQAQSNLAIPAQSCVKTYSTLGCKMQNAEFHLYSLSNLQLLSSIASEYLDSSYLFSVDDEFKYIYLYTSTIEIYTEDGNLVQKVTQPNGLIYEIQFFQSILAYRNPGYVTICQRSNFNQIGQIVSIGGGKITKFFFIQEYYHMVFFTTNIRHSQISSYSLNTFETIMAYTCAYSQNDCTVIVDAYYDRDQNSLLLIDMFGSFQAINYQGVFQAKIILKIPDFTLPKFNNLKGFSVDLRTNNLLIYNSLSVYYIPYGDLNDYIKQIQGSKSYIFTDVSYSNQDLQNNTYIIIGDQGILKKYQQSQYTFFYYFDEEVIQIQYNQMQEILIIAFLDKIIIFQELNQTSIQQSPYKSSQNQEILLGSSLFSRFLCQDIFLTTDSAVWHYNFTTQMVLYRFSFNQLSSRISSELFSVSSNLLLLGLSSGDLVIYNLIVQKEKIFHIGKFDQENAASISFIKETQRDFFICYSSGLGVYQISKTTYSIRQILRFQDLQTYQIIQDSSVSIFEVDEKFSRIYLNFASERIVRKYQYDQNPLTFEYIMLTKRQQNKIYLGNNILVFYSSAFMLIHDRETLKYLSSIRRLNDQYFITDIKLIQDTYLLIISQQRVELFTLTTIQSPQLVDQVNVTNPIVVNFQIQNFKKQIKSYINPNILFVVILAENQIIEKRYSLDYEESKDEQRYCFASFQVQNYFQFLKELSQVKPQTYPSSTQIDILANPNSSQYNYLMVKYTNQNNFPLNNQNTKNSSILFYSNQISTPIDNYQSITQLNVNNFTLLYNQKQDVLLRDFQIVFQDKKIYMNHYEQTQNIYFQNFFFTNQDLTNVICNYNNLKKVVFKRYTFFNSFMGGTQDENSFSLLNFQNIQQLYIYDLIIDNNFSNKTQFKSLLTANNVNILVIKNLTIRNTQLEQFINISRVEQLFIENINIINCKFQNMSRNQYIIPTIFLVTGVQTTTFRSVSMINCQDLSLIISLNTQQLDKQQVNFKSDTIIFKNLNIQQNNFLNITNSPIILAQNSYITLTNVNYTQNQGNIYVQKCVEFEINQSFLSNNQNEDGGALFIKNCLNQISLSNISFISNRAFASGGAILIQEFYGNFSIQVSSTIIKDNTALIGGGLRILNQNVDKFGLNFWNQIKYVFINNTAELYGNNFTTFLQDIYVSLPQNRTQQGDEEQGGNTTLIQYLIKDQLNSTENESWYGVAVIDNFRSGSYFILQLCLIDLERREFTYSPYKLTQNLYPLTISQEITQIQFKLEKVSPSSFISITGQDIITYQQFIESNSKYIFQQVQVTSLPKTQQHIQISYILNSYQKVKNKPILVKVNLRKCQRGEIVKQISKNIFSCFQCPVGFYSVDDPQQPSYQQNTTQNKTNQNNQIQQCNHCPSEAFFCQRDIIQLKNGYWRENEYSTEIIQCNNIQNACRGQDSSSKNYCEYGHVGPVCRECDYQGNIWNGKKFSKSLQNELKCSECLFLYLQVSLTIFIFISFLVYLQLQMIVFMNSFMQQQTYYYLRVMKIIPILNNTVKDQSSFYLKILINFTQISSILVAYQNSIFPDVFALIPSFLGSPTNSIMISISCLVSQLSKSEVNRIQAIQILQSILPFVYLAFCLLITNFLKAIKYFDIKNYHKFTLINLLFVFFQPNQVSFFSNQLVCTKLGSKYYVSSNMNIDCNDPYYRNFAYIISIPFLLFWSFLPLFIFFKLKKRSKTLDYCNTRYIFGYYYTEFKNKFYYWEIIRIYIRVLIVVLSTLLKEYSYINQQICVFILYIYIKSAIYYSPIVNKNLQKFDNFCYQVIIFNTILSTINSSLQSQILLAIIWTIHFLFIMKIIFQIIVFKFSNPQNFFRKNLVSLLSKLNFNSLCQNLQQRQNKERKSLYYWKYIFKNIQVLIKKQAYEQINQHSSSNYLNQTQSQTLFLQSIHNFQANFIEQKTNSIINNQNQSIFSLQNENTFKRNYELQQSEAQNENFNFHNKYIESNEMCISGSSKSSNMGEQKETKIILQKNYSDKSQELINGLQDLDLNIITQNVIFQQNYETQFKLLKDKEIFKKLNKFDMIKVLIAIWIIKLSVQQAYLCSTGCKKCDQKGICDQCEDSFFLDSLNNACIYQDCYQEQFFQKKQNDISTQKDVCQAICDQGFWENSLTNTCESILSCSQQFNLKTGILRNNNIKDIIVINNNIFLVMYQSQGSFISTKEGNLFNNNNTIIQYSLLQEQMQNITQQYGVFDSSTQLIDVNNQFAYLVNYEKQQTKVFLRLILKDNNQLNFQEQISMDLLPSQFIYFFKDILFKFNRNFVSIYQVIIQGSSLFLQQISKELFCISSIPSIQKIIKFKDDLYLMISSFSKNVIQLSSQDCTFFTLEEEPVNIKVSTVNATYYLAIQFQNKIILFDRNLTNLQIINNKNKNQIIDFITVKINNFLQILVILYSNNDVNICYFNQQLQNFIVINISQTVIQNPLSILNLQTNQINDDIYQLYILVYSQSVQTLIYYYHIKTQEILIEDQYFLSYFQRRDTNPQVQINSLDLNSNTSILSTCSANGLITTWDISNIYQPRYIGQQNIYNQGTCKQVIFVDDSTLVSIFDNSIVFLDVIHTQIINQIPYQNSQSKQIQRFCIKSGDFTALLYDSCLVILNNDYSQVVKNCSAKFDDNIINFLFDSTFYIVLQKDKQIDVFEFDPQGLQISFIQDYQSSYSIQQLQLRNFLAANQIQNKQILEIIIYNSNSQFIILNEQLQIIYQINSIPLSLAINILFVQSDPNDIYYFISGYNPYATYQFQTYIIPKFQNTYYLAGFSFSGNMLLNNFLLLSYCSVINFYTWNLEKPSAINSYLQFYFGVFFSQILSRKQFYIFGDKNGLTGFNTIQNQEYTLIYQMESQDLDNGDEIQYVKQNMILGKYFIIKSNVLVYSLYTNLIIEKLDIGEPFQQINQFEIIEDQNSILILKQNIMYLKNYSTNSSLLQKSLGQITKFIILQDSIFVYGSQLTILDFQLSISQKTNSLDAIAQNCILIQQMIACQIENGGIQLFGQSSLNKLYQIISSEINYQMTIDNSYQNIYLYSNLIQIYSIQGKFMKIIDLEQGTINELSFYSDIFACRTNAQITIIERNTLNIRGSIQSQGSATILGMYFIKEFYHLAIYTNNVKYGQVFCYNLKSLAIKTSYSNSFILNQKSQFVQILFDKEQSFLISLDRTELTPQSKAQGKGFNLDFRTNNMLIYTQYTVYQVSYGDFGNRIIKIQTRNTNIYCQLQQYNQNLQLNGAIIIAGEQGILYKYVNTQLKYFYNFKENITQIYYSSKNDYLLVALTTSIACFYKVTYQSILNQSGWKLNYTLQYLDNNQFVKFYNENLFLTMDNQIWHLDFEKQKIIFKFKLKNQKDRITCDLYSQQQGILYLGLSNGDFIIYDTISILFQTINIQSKFQQSQKIYSPIVNIVETQSSIWISYLTQYGVYKLSKSNKQFEMILNFTQIQTFQFQQDINVDIFGVDDVYFRFFINFATEQIVRVYNYKQQILQMDYLILSKKQHSQLLLTENMILFYSSCAIIIRDRSTLGYIQTIRRANNYNFIKRVVVLEDTYFLLTYEYKYELISLNKDYSVQYIDQQQLSDPILIKHQIIQDQSSSTNRILQVILLSMDNVQEFQYNLRYEVSQDQNKKCGVSINVVTYLDMLQKIQNVKPFVYFDPTLQVASVSSMANQKNQYMVTLQESNLSIISFQSTQDNSLVISSQKITEFGKQNLNKLLIGSKSFSQYTKYKVNLRDFELQFNQPILNITFSSQTQIVNLQNIFISKQNLGQIQFQFVNLRRVVIDYLTFSQNVRISKNGQDPIPLFLFSNCSEVFIYNLFISNSGKAQHFYYLLSIQNVSSLKIIGFKVFNTILASLIHLRIAQNTFFSDVEISNCYFKKDNSNETQSHSYVFNLVGLQNTNLQNFQFINNSNLQLLQTLNQYDNSLALYFLQSDNINIQQFNLLGNNQTQQQFKPLILLQNTKIILKDSNFRNNQGNLQILYSNQTSISNSNFINNISEDGGSLQLIACQDLINIQNTTFVQNQALASGGAIYIEEFYGKIYLDKNVKILSNKALIGGGMRIKNYVFNNDDQIWEKYKFLFNQNYANIYGNNFATYLRTIKIENNRQQSQFDTDINYESPDFQFIEKNQMNETDKKKWESIAQYSNFKSGSYLMMNLHIFDIEGSVFKFSFKNLTQNLYPSQIVEEIKNIYFKIEDNSQSNININGQNIVTYEQFVEEQSLFSFSQVTISSIPTRQKQLLISYSISLQNNQNFKPILLLLNFRDCKVGEILKQADSNSYNCEQCQLGYYSLEDPTSDQLWQQVVLQEKNVSTAAQVQCIKCPDSADSCQSNQIQIKDGYWRANNKTSEIIQCNLNTNSCKPNDPLSSNGCSEGYIGPICSVCDVIGKYWIDNRYTSSFVNDGKCEKCSSQKYQIIFIALTFLILCLYFLISVIMFTNNFMHYQKCQYLRLMQMIPIYRSQIKDQSIFYLKIFINYIQMNSLIITHPFSVITEFLMYFPAFLNSPTNRIVISLNCIINKNLIDTYGNAHIMQIIQAILPLFFLAFMTILMKILEKLKVFGIKNFHLFTLANFIYIFFQPNQINFFSKQLTCTQVGQNKYVSSDLQIDCDDPSYKKIAYAISIPCLLFWREIQRSLTIAQLGTVMVTIIQTINKQFTTGNLQEYTLESQQF